MHIVQGKRLTGETCIIEHIITGTLDQFQHSQTQASPDEQATIGLANQKSQWSNYIWIGATGSLLAVMVIAPGYIDNPSH